MGTWQEGRGPRFRKYVEDVRRRARTEDAGLQIEDGRVRVSGVSGVMVINGIIAKMIFDKNKNTREFFVEESYVIDWMYPDLEPHGLIFRLNKTPSNQLSEKTIKMNNIYWRQKLKYRQKQPGYVENVTARTAFSKLRAAIAGLYAYRELHEHAENALQQALEIYPASPEAASRPARLYEQNGRVDKAVELLTAFVQMKHHHPVKWAKRYLEYLESTRPLAPERAATARALIQELGDESNAVRRKARGELGAIGPRVVPILREHAGRAMTRRSD